MAIKKYLDYEGLTEYDTKIKEYIGDRGMLEFKGVVATVSALPTVADQKVGWMYAVSEEGLTTADFVDGAGKKVSENSEVAAVNVGTAQSPQMKWSLLGPVFDVSDKLTFGSTMPANPEDGETFLYLGNTTYTYSAVTPEGSENPQEEGWYESDGSGSYTATSDTSVDAGKTYYTRAEQYAKGVIYVYNESSSAWVAQPSGDTFTAITNAEIDALFE